MTETVSTATRSSTVQPPEPAGYTVQKWTPDLIDSLDWRRVVEIARAMALTAGFELGATKMDVAGGAEFIMSAGKALERINIPVRLAQWQRWQATEECLESFAGKLRSEKLRNGVFIAPAGFTPAAAALGKQAGVELVDAKSLAEKLNALPTDHSAYFFDIGTAGDASTPSCPICLKRLARCEDEPQAALDFQALPDVSYRSNDIVAEPVLACCLEVHKFCEVRFLSEVRAQEMIVSGIADGDFICEGTLVLNPGSILRGSVAARSMLVRPGAQLEGETCVLEGTLTQRKAPITQWVWRCKNPEGREQCKAVRFTPHD